MVNVGIGTASPPGKFHVKNDAVGSDSSFVILQSGNVGIGTTAPGYKLHVIGDVFATGVVYCNSAALCSDIRWKKNIVPMQQSLSNVLKMQGVTYDWKVNEFPEKHFSNNQQVGLSAQEMEKIYPQVVVNDKDGYKKIDYDSESAETN